MTTEKMNIHKALSELKVSESRIMKAIHEATFVIANKQSNEKIEGLPVEEFKEKMRAAHNKVMDLINRRNALKRAVVMSNAITEVVINGKTYTVAEAIELKNHGLQLKEAYRNTLSRQNLIANSIINANSGAEIEEKAEAFILSMIQSMPKEQKDSKLTTTSESMQELRANYIRNNRYNLIDPLKTAKLIEDLTDEISEFEIEVDSALSVSNALTIIELSY